MSTSLKDYETDEPPEEYARRVCEWHAANEGAPLTHEEVMVVHFSMADPESRRRCRIMVNALTSPGGEFEHLREMRKFAANRRASAERQGVSYRRVRRLPVINRMKVVDKQRKALAAREHLPVAVKEPVSLMLDAIERAQLDRGRQLASRVKRGTDGGGFGFGDSEHPQSIARIVSQPAAGKTVADGHVSASLLVASGNPV